MKKGFIVISFLISMVIIIAHDTIHHHHNSPENFEFLSGSHSDDHRPNDNDEDHHNHFPPHQHVISEGDLLANRNTVTYNKVIKDSNQDLDLLSFPFSEYNSYTSFTDFVHTVRKPLSTFPFIIPVNSTRGSPSIS